jgi:hypothetical protein
MLMEIDTNNGNNVNQKNDISIIVDQFIHYYYKTLIENHNQLFIDKIFDNSSEINVNGIIYKGKDEIYSHLTEFIKNVQINVTKYNFTNSGSRRINILVIGYILNNNTNIPFSQYIHLASFRDIWWIQSYIINNF